MEFYLIKYGNLQKYCAKCGSFFIFSHIMEMYWKNNGGLPTPSPESESNGDMLEEKWKIMEE